LAVITMLGAAIAQSLWRLGYGLDDRGSVLCRSNDGNFSLCHCVQTDSGAHPASYLVDTGGCYPRGKAASAWNWPLTSI